MGATLGGVPGGAATTGPDAPGDGGAGGVGGGVTVGVPLVPYEARADEFRTGPFRSRLDVLHNDSGPRRPDTLRLLDQQGRVVPEVVDRSVGTFRVVDGLVELTPRTRPEGAVTFRYRVLDQVDRVRTATATVTAYPAVIDARRDDTTTSPGQPVTIAVADNDELLVPGAVRTCTPVLSEKQPAPVDPVPVVLPEPERPPAPCPAPGRLLTRDGTWTVGVDGTVRLVPVRGRTGAAVVYYAQTTDFPFDVGVARVQVVVTPPGGGSVEPTPTPSASAGPGPTTDPGPSAGPGPSTGPGGTPTPSPGPGGGSGSGSGGSGGGITGPLARTGVEVGGLLLIGGGLVAAGLGLRRAGRRRPARRA